HTPARHSFPTRRSSDLTMAENVAAKPTRVAPTQRTLREYETIYLLRQDLTPEQVDRIKERLRAIVDREGGRVIRFTTWGKKKTRSEEHTSELQSRENLV